MVLQGLQILGLHILASLRTRVRLVCKCACLVLKTRQDLFCRFAKLVVASVQHMGLHTWKLLAAFFANKIRFFCNISKSVCTNMAHVYACFALCNNLVCKTCNIDVHVDCFQDLCFYKHVHLFAILQLLQICKFGWEVWQTWSASVWTCVHICKLCFPICKHGLRFCKIKENRLHNCNIGLPCLVWQLANNKLG